MSRMLDVARPFGGLAIAAVLSMGLIVPSAAFNDPPNLEAAVKSGALPPVDERLPEHPQVWANNEWNPEVGTYGGELRVTTQHFIQAMAQVGFARLTNDRTGFVPDLAESFEWNEDKTAITFHLRKGVKWSDGVPFTADDVMFWWNDIIHSKYNEKPLSSPGFDTVNDKIVVVDDYTLRFEFARPNPSFLFLTRGFSDGEQGFAFRARHFWTKYFPSADTPEADAKTQFRELLDSMYRSPPFIWRNDAAEVPVLYPWKAVRYEEGVLLELERNPYFWSVDADGNQLPYIDTVTSYLMSESNPEQIKLRVISGEIDWDRRIGTVVDVPLFMDAAESADIKLTYTLQPVGSMQGIYIGWNVPDDKKRALLRNVDFRRALSVAIDREVVNQTAALGLGTVGQGYSDVGKYDPAIDGSYAQFDPALANQLLDSIGLNKRDGEGFRTYSDGTPLTLAIAYVPGWLEGGLVTVETAVEGWRAVGLRVNALSVTHQVRSERELRGDLDLWVRPATGGFPLYGLQYGFGVPLFAKPQVDAWLEQEKSGTSPTDMSPEMSALIDAYERAMRAEPFGPDFETAMTDYRKLMAENLFVLGVVQDLPKIFISRTDLANVPGSDTPDGATLVIGTGDEEFPTRSFFHSK